MKKKLMMVAVLLGALTLGACVDDNESQSVTDVRNAKAEQLKSIAAMNNAEAQAKIIYAEADAKIKEQEAALKKAQADKAAAEAEVAKLKAQMDAAAYDAELAARLAQAEKKKANAEAKLASIQGEAEKYQLELKARIAVLQKELLVAQNKLTNAQDKAESAEMVRLETLAKKYATLLYSLTEEKNNLADLNATKLKMEADLANWKVEKEKTVAANKITIELIDKQVAYYKEYENYTEDLVGLKNAMDLKYAEYWKSKEEVNALWQKYNNASSEASADETLAKQLEDMNKLDLVVFFTNKSDYSVGTIYFGNYCPITKFEKVTDEAQIKKGDYSLSIDSLALEVEAQDLRLLKVEVDKAIANLDIKGLTEAIDKADEGTKAKLEVAKKATIAAETAYKADATKEQAYRDALAAEEIAQANYDNSVKSLDDAKTDKANLEKYFALVSTNTADLKKAVNEYNDAIRTTFAPVAELNFSYLDKQKTTTDLWNEYSAMSSVYGGYGETQMTLAEMLWQQYGYKDFTGEGNMNYDEWFENPDGTWGKYTYSQSVHLDIWNLVIVQNKGSLQGAKAIQEAIELLEAEKARLEKQNANYAKVTKKEQAINLKQQEIDGLAAIIEVIEIQMNQAKATLDAAIKAATPAE